MDITQLLIIVGTVVGVVLVGLLAVVPSLLDRPAGHDQPDPAPALRPTKNGVDLAA